MSYPGYGGPPAWSGNVAYSYPPYGEYYPPSQYPPPPPQPGQYGYEYGPQGSNPHGHYPHGPPPPPPPVFHAPHSHFTNSHSFPPHPSSLHSPGYHAHHPQAHNPHGPMPLHHFPSPHQLPPYGHMPPTSHQMSPQAFSTPSHPIPPPAFEEHWQHHPSHPAWSYPQSTPGFPPRHESNGPPRVHPIAGSWRKPSRTSKSNSLPGIEARDRNSVNEDGSLKLNAGNLKELQGSMAPAKPSAASSPGSSAMKIESEFPSPEEPDHEKNSAPTTTYPNYLNASKLATADASRSNSMKDAEPSAPTEAKANAHQTTTSASSMASKVQEASVSDPSAISRPTPWRPDQSQASSSRYTPDATSQRQVPPASTSVKPSVEADESVASDDSYSPPPVFVKAPMTRHSADAAPVLKRVPSHFGYNSCPRGIDGFQMIPPPPPPMQPPPPPPDSPPGDIDTNDRPRTPNWGILDKQLRGTPPVSSIEEDASQDGEVEGVAKASKQSAFDLSHDGASAQPTQSSIDRSPKVESEYALKRSAKSKQRSSPKANTPKSESGGARKRKREDPNWEKKMRTRSARRYIL